MKLKMLSAIQQNDVKKVKLLFERHDELTKKNKFSFLFKRPINLHECVFYLGRNALHLAAIKGHLNLVDFFLKRNADIDKGDEDGKTALHLAILYGNQDVVMFLLSAGANVNKQCSKGRTALYYATESRMEALVKELIKMGANVNTPDNSGKTPLFEACRHNVMLIYLLITAGSNVNQVDQSGNTPLSVAIDHSTLVKAISLLINAGADINQANSYGETPIFYAINNCDVTTVALLISNGANVNHLTHKKETPLSHLFTRMLGTDTSTNQNLLVILYELIKAGGAMFSDLPFWPDFSPNNMLLIGTTVKNKKVRYMNGFSNAITTLDELPQSFITNDFFRKSLLNACKKVPTKDKHYQIAQKIKSKLYELPPTSLVNRCLNFCNKPENSDLREKVAMLKNLPLELIEKLNIEKNNIAVEFQQNMKPRF